MAAVVSGDLLAAQLPAPPYGLVLLVIARPLLLLYLPILYAIATLLNPLSAVYSIVADDW